MIRHSLVVFKLLQGENVLVEIFLKLLVCIVDVELLEAVDLREEKSADVRLERAQMGR